MKNNQNQLLLKVERNIPISNLYKLKESNLILIFIQSKLDDQIKK